MCVWGCVWGDAGGSAGLSHCFFRKLLLTLIHGSYNLFSLLNIPLLWKICTTNMILKWTTQIFPQTTNKKCQYFRNVICELWPLSVLYKWALWKIILPEKKKIKAIAIKIVWYWHKTDTEWWNWTESPESPHAHTANESMTSVPSKDNREKMVSSTNGSGNSGYLYAKEWNWTLFLCHIQQSIPKVLPT